MTQPPDVILITRHAEKPDPAAGSFGVDHLGRSDAHSLSVRGWQRAGALAALLANAPETAYPELVRPQRVIATRPSTSEKSRREVDTATPVADRLGLCVVDDHGHREIPALVQEVLAESSPVLVVWHHREIPQVAQAVGADPNRIPSTWPKDRFDLGGMSPADESK